MTATWIGVGPAPGQVVLRVYSGANGGATPNGQFDLNNGLSSLITTHTDTVYAIWKNQYGYVDKLVSISGGSGQIQLEKYAKVTVTSGNDLSAYASAKGGYAMVADRVVVASGNPSPTCRASIFLQRVANTSENARDLEMDIVAEEQFQSSSYVATAYFDGILWGPWTSPSGGWAWNDFGNPHWSRAFHVRTYNTTSIQDLILNGPEVRSNTINVTDGSDQHSSSATVTVRTHAPWEYPTWVDTETKYTEWVGVSGWVHRSPYASVTVTQTGSYAESITKTLSIGVNGSYTLIPAPHPLVLGLDLAYQYGETATVTTTTSQGYTVPAGTADMKYRIEKRVYWKEITGAYMAYGADGFVGLRGMRHVGWTSGSKGAAEASDCEFRLRAESIEE